MSSSAQMLLDKSSTARGLEFAALASIFPDEFESLDELPPDICSRGGWVDGMIPESRCFRMRFSSGVPGIKPADLTHVEAELFVAIGPGYPSAGAPILIEVQNIRGLSEDLVGTLCVELKAIAAEKQPEGVEIMYDLVHAAQDFLRRYHDEMIEQERQSACTEAAGLWCTLKHQLVP